MPRFPQRAAPPRQGSARRRTWGPWRLACERGAGVVSAHARGDHDPRAHRGGRAGDRPARAARGQRRPARGRHHEPELPRELRRHGLRRAPARQAHRDLSASTAPPSASPTRPPPKLGMAPGVAAMFEEPPCLVTLFIDGREMTRRRAARAGRARRDRRATCAAFHDSGTELPTGFDSFRLVEEYAESGRERGSRAARGLRRRARRRRSGSRRRCDDQPTHERVPAHNDLLTANFLRDGDRIQLIDWEYAGMGDRWFDLGNFAVNNELDDDAGGAAARGLLRRAAGRAATARR